MGDFDRHFKLMNEKKETAYDAFVKKNFSPVGDEAIKTVEQALEADAAKQKKHLGGHGQRFTHARKIMSWSLFDKMKKLWLVYEDLGYEGHNGNRAKEAIKLVNDLLKFFSKKWGVKIEIRDFEKVG